MITATNGTRFLIGQFIDDDKWAMGFFTFVGGRYELMDIPAFFKPSNESFRYLWKELGTIENLPLAVPGGYYFMDQYYTLQGLEEDDEPLLGNVLERIVGPDGITYNLVVSEEAGDRYACFALYLGTVYENTPQEIDLWRPTPIPRSLLNDKAIMYSIYGTVDEIDATLLEMDSRFN